ncbi:hypothetical protein [Selenomonas ruminantium]|uniref:hypothetical protein n=1 Tax=Selenomonas ruminantium TaxID=971 RepID=UPI0026F2EDEB|nr:hypothetical protein [Selenomonas ruminantium]
MIDFLLARVKAMAESTKNKPWQHEMAFNYARRALLLVLSIAPLCQEAQIMRAEIEMAYPEFPLDIFADEG